MLSDMAKRKIIEINEELCNGCGDCITACHEGALAIVNGRAKVVNESFCDGLGACIKGCSAGALTVVEREAEPFVEPPGMKAAQAVHVHGGGSGCPGSQVRSFQKVPSAPSNVGRETPSRIVPSELTHWPVQLHLVRPEAPFFADKELVVLSTCAPVACPDVHWRFLRGRAVVLGCPKLDRTEGYVEKLAGIFSAARTPRVLVVRMEVPCCGGLTAIVEEAAALSGRTDLIIEEATIGVNGDYQGITTP